MKDEFSFIRSITPDVIQQRSLKIGIGDDAAVYESDSSLDQVVCVDTMVEGIHFRKDTMEPVQIGRKALAINISDLAAMGATPRFYLTTIAVPPTWTEDHLREIYRGMSELGKQFKMDLIGGDTVSIEQSLVITVTAIGTVASGRAIKRTGARKDDIVFVTGPIGGSAAGFDLLNERTKDGHFSSNELSYVKMHQEPMPQVKLGELFSQSNQRMSLNDISDGLSSESFEIAVASNVQVILNKAHIVNLSPQLDVSLEKRVKWSLNGGEDFQLVGTTSAEQYEVLQKQAKAIGFSLFPVGVVREGKPAVFLDDGDKELPLEMGGYNHFKRG
ncbi:thiamine-monophosphate kinase [Bacillus sp. JCM 19045]|nr:thiamine-monophosphate kinase [Bacillus sp. JCM 19045]